MHTFQPTPYPYQLEGALRAAHAGHTLIADEPGLGKTLQALAVQRITKAKRTLIICPPILTTNWEKETRRTHNNEHINGELIKIRPQNPISGKNKTAQKKALDQLPNAGTVIVPDSLIVARGLDYPLAMWEPDLLILDEAHRYKTPTAKRTKAVAHIAKHADKTLALTGTPIISTPLDLLPLLTMTGHLHHFAKTPWEYINRYTYENHFGARVANPKTLPELHTILDKHVWTRRTKNQVLTELPPKRRSIHWVTPDTDTLDKANRELAEKIDIWLDNLDTNPTNEDITGFVGDCLPFVAQLRKATGLAKVDAATDWITTRLNAEPSKPLIVWIQHRDVSEALISQLRKENPYTSVELIDGTVTGPARDDIVERFQNGGINVLVAQIAAAGVGLTLTRASTALFVETDWTPALVVQAEDRIHRISQTASVELVTLVAAGTLDERIHDTLAKTIRVLETLTPGSDVHVATETSGAVSASTILHQLITERINERNTTNGTQPSECESSRVTVRA